MIDLETFGTAPGSVLLSIGAVKFDRHSIHKDTFYRRIDPNSCVHAGMKIDIPTIMWWLNQSAEARREISLPGEDLRSVLAGFNVWMPSPLDCNVWGNGADFDGPLLAAAYAAIGLPLPWKFYNSRCYRTMKNLFPQIEMQRSGTHHNALDDATSQAWHLTQIWDEMERLQKRAEACPHAWELACRVYHQTSNDGVWDSAELDYIQDKMQQLKDLLD